MDCVHWNAGLWDSLFMPDGEHHTPIEIYKYYIERVCNRIKRLFPNAKVIFATSTPVVEERFLGECKRYNKDIELYNAAAVEIVQKHGFVVNDLYEITKDIPIEYYSDMTHLNTKEGTRLLTDKVIETIENVLDVKAKELDYDEFFSEKNDIIGI